MTAVVASTNAPSEVTGGAAGDPVWVVRRARELTGALVLCALAFSQAGAQLVADTKLDLAIDPAGFLARALQAWDSQAAFGQVQNQAYGYLWPMGPFFLLGHALHLPGWAVQRLWWCLVLLAAYVGMLLLLRALRIGTPTSRLVAALAFALSPRILTTLGGISVESWPGALVPWILLPLVIGARGGSPRRAAALSALAVGCLGGVNATASVVALLPPMIFLVTRERGPRRTRLMAWWAGLSLAAIAWWVAPLVLMSRYSYPFLAYIESATTTTAPLSAVDNLRGTNHWVGFLVLDGAPSWPAGWWLSTTAPAIVATSLLAALGLLGVIARSCPERRFFRVSLLLGLAVLGIGYAGALGSPVAPWIHAALDGWAAPLRNLHKFDVLVRLPLAAGLAAVIPLCLPVVRRVVRRGFVDQDGRDAHRVAAAAAVLVVALPLVVVASPALRGDLAQYGSFSSVPQPWSDASAWLSAHGPDDRTLLLPASNFGEYSWGRPRDEPFQSLAASPWGIRNIVPLGAPGATRWLDAIQSAVAQGAPSADLAAALRSGGVRYVLLRTDLDPGTGVVDPTIVRATLLASPGLRRAATFGDPDPGSSPTSTDAVGVVPLPQIEIYEVVEAGAPVTAVPLDSVRAFSGGPEALMTSGLASRAPAWVALPDAPTGTRGVVTDTLRRRLMNVGAQRGSDYTPTLTADSSVSRGGAAGDISPWPAGTDETMLQYSGIASVTASSSVADPFSGGYLGPEYRPFSAVDGLSSTQWLASPSDPSPWWRATFSSRELRSVTILLAAPDEVSRLTVVTDAGTVHVDVGTQQRSTPILVALPAGTTTTIEIQLESVPRRTRPTGLVDVRLPEVAAAESVHVPTAVGDDGAVFTRTPGARRSCVPTPTAWACSALWSRQGEEVAGMDRSFAVERTTSLTAGVWLRARQGTALDALADAASGLTVTGSSRFVDDVAARPGAALDDDPSTSWIPAVTDLAPSLEVTYSRPVTAAQVVVTDGLAHAAFSSAVITAAGRTFEVPLRSGAAAFSSVTSERWRIQLRRTSAAGGRIAVPRVNVVLRPVVSAPAAREVRVTCADGLAANIDGRAHPVSLAVSLHDLLVGGALPATTCDGVPVPLAAGPHRLTTTSTDSFEVVTVNLGVARTASPAAGSPVTIRAWAAEDREVLLTEGTDTVVALAEGYNVGWAATMDGAVLEPVRLDGWRQGWRVPSAMSSRDVQITYVPGATQRRALAVGAFLLLIVVAAALIRGSSVQQPAVAARGGRRETGMAALLVPLVIASWPGLVVGCAALASARRVGPRPRGFAAGGAVVLAGLVAALTSAAWGGTLAAGAVQLLAVVAVALVAVSGLDDPVSPGAAGETDQGRTLDDQPGRDGHGDTAE